MREKRDSAPRRHFEREFPGEFPETGSFLMSDR